MVENATLATTRRKTSHESYSRTGTSLGLEGPPVTSPEVGNVERERNLYAYHGLVVRAEIHRQAPPFAVGVGDVRFVGIGV